MSNAIALFESKGLTSLLSGLDVLLKSDGVEIVGVYKIGGGIVACVAKGAANVLTLSIHEAVEKVKSLQGEVLGYQVIPDPHERLLDCLQAFYNEKVASGL